MITPGDDYPLHQSARPVRHAGTDRNLYDRFFFNGYDRDGTMFLALAMGQYPGRNIADGAFSVVVDGVQHNVRASRLLGDDRLDTRVGPLRVTILEPLRRLRLQVDDEESGLAADLEFAARAPAFEEAPYRWDVEHRTIFDYTRLTQNGTWSGSVTVADRTIDVTPDQWRGTRDRSWGIRPVGERDAGAPAMPRGFYWLWAPINFEDSCALFDVNEHPDGTRWHHEAMWAPVGALDQAVERGRADYRMTFRPGTRHAASFELGFDLPSGRRSVRLEPQWDFLMHGIGYTHPTWGHGTYVGDDVRESDSFPVAGVDESAPMNQHVQTIVRAERDDGAIGIGILEQLIFGPHEPSGLTGLLDMHA